MRYSFHNGTLRRALSWLISNSAAKVSCCPQKESASCEKNFMIQPDQTKYNLMQST